VGLQIVGGHLEPDARIGPPKPAKPRNGIRIREEDDYELYRSR
jgi:hypothetical protein